MSNRNTGAAPLLIWGALVLFYFYQFIARSSFPTVLTDEYMRHFVIDTTGVGVLASCYYFVYTFMQIPAGIVIDKYSSRYIGTMATFVCALGVLIFVATTNCYVAGVGQMFVGFGSAFAFLLALKAISMWFPSDKITVMSSYTMSIGCLGPVVGGPLVSHVVKAHDWTSVMKIFGVLGIIFALVVWYIVKDKPSEGKQDDQQFALVESLKMILTSPQAWVLALFTMMLYAPLSALGDLWGVAFLKSAYGVDSTVAAFANNMIYVGTVIGSPIFAYLAILMGSYKKPMMIGMATAALSLGIVIFFSSIPIEAVFVLFFITGFSCGAMLSYPLAMSSFPKSVGGTLSGFINMMSMVSGVVLMPFIGWIINLCWDGTIENGVKIYKVADYRCGLSAVIVFLVVGVLVSMLIKDRSPRDVGVE